MEEINKEIEGKSIERVKTEIKEVVEEVQPKKTRSEAQKRAFEKARAKRQANLEAKKEEQELDDWAESELQKEDPQPAIKDRLSNSILINTGVECLLSNSNRNINQL